MYQIVNNTVKIPLADLKNDLCNTIKIEKKGRKYAYLNLEQYEDLLSILNDTKFKKGDRVFWFKNYSSQKPKQITEETVNIKRIDVITKVIVSFDKYSTILGDSIRYNTAEEKGDKKGIAYESYLIKVSDFNRLNGTCF